MFSRTESSFKNPEYVYSLLPVISVLIHQSSDGTLKLWSYHRYQHICLAYLTYGLTILNYPFHFIFSYEIPHFLVSFFCMVIQLNIFILYTTCWCCISLPVVSSIYLRPDKIDPTRLDPTRQFESEHESDLNFGHGLGVFRFTLNSGQPTSPDFFGWVWVKKIHSRVAFGSGQICLNL